MEIKAYAKLNFYLDIESKRVDGYHNIISIMQTVDWYDEIKIEKSVSNETTLLTHDANLPNEMENTAYRAAKKYLEVASLTEGIEIEVRKNIPVAAGMAGGSADAAAVLLGLNEMFEKRLSDKELQAIGAEIGADVPFCLMGGTALVSGIGSQILRCDDFPDCTILCAKYGVGVSTPMAYRLLDEKYHSFRQNNLHRNQLDNVILGIKNQSPSEAAKGFFNIFEDVIPDIDPSVNMLKRIMSENGAYVSQMSGSGSSVFGFFQNDRDAEPALKCLLQAGATAKICHPVKPNL